jgi:hypothetical protein
MNDTLTNTPLTEEVERERVGRRARGDDLYSRTADEIATTVDTDKARRCIVSEDELINWQSYVRYYLKKKGLKLVYRKIDEMSVQAWAVRQEKKVSPK